MLLKDPDSEATIYWNGNSTVNKLYRNINASYIIDFLTWEKISPNKKLLNIDNVDGRLACFTVSFIKESKEY